MIKGNTIYFGYGDVGVGSDYLIGCMIFTNIKPPQEIGSKLGEKIKNNEPEIGKELVVYEKECYDLLNVFKTVTEDNKIVKYKEYTFDFSNYNIGSINVCLRHANNTVNTMLLAC